MPNQWLRKSSKTTRQRTGLETQWPGHHQHPSSGSCGRSSRRASIPNRNNAYLFLWQLLPQNKLQSRSRSLKESVCSSRSAYRSHLTLRRRSSYSPRTDPGQSYNSPRLAQPFLDASQLLRRRQSQSPEKDSRTRYLPYQGGPERILQEKLSLKRQKGVKTRR